MNDRGIARFGEYLDSLSTDAPHPFPVTLLEDDQFTSPTEFDVKIEKREFNSRFDAAKYFADQLCGIDQELFADIGLWSWLSLFYFDVLCPKKGGRFVPGERARWIPAVTEHRRYYRHLLAAPYRIYQANRDNPARAMLFLFGPLGTVGHFYYQIVSRQELITNKSIVQLATSLYFDGHKQKRGSQTLGKPGTVFRLVTFLNQLEKTWDLYSMSYEELLDRLPSEYDRFRP